MILTQQSRILETEGDLKVNSFGIDAQDFSMLFHILRNSLYEDKTKAVIREYSCNAYDANVEAGKGDLPIQVHLPNVLEPEFRVRDFGTGLSDEDVTNTYVKYCKSTKRNSNATIGMLGIGSKSGFAYGDSFSIVSYQEGVKTTYTAFIDPSQEGRIAQMDKSPTEEPDGIEIIVPVNEFDFEEFRLKAQDVFRFWKVAPKIIGNRYYNQIPLEEAFSGKNWVMYKNQTTSYAVMGQVAYPIRASVFTSLDAKLERLLQSGLVFHFNIGDLDIAVNREGLQYTDKTKNAILLLCREIIGGFEETVKAKFASARTLWNAREIWADLFLDGAYSSNLRYIIEGLDLQFGGQSVKGTNFMVPEDFYKRNNLQPNDVFIERWYRNGRKKVSLEIVDRLPFKKDLQVYIKDATRCKSRVSYHFKETYCEYVWMIVATKPEYRELLLKEMGLEDLVPQLKSVKELPVPPNTYNGNNEKNSKKVFVFNPDGRAKSDFWDIAEVDLEEGGVYVEIDRYEVCWEENDKKRSKFIQSVLDTLRSLNYPVPVVYGFKKALVAKEDLSEWVTLKDYLIQAVEATIAKEDLSQLIADKEAFDSIEESYLGEYKWSGVKKDSPFAELLRAYIKLEVASKKARQKLAIINVINSAKKGFMLATESTKTPSVDFASLKSDVLKHYPLYSYIKHAMESYGFEKEEEDIQKDLLAYIREK